MNLIKELENLGLADKEAKVYLASLELGQASVQNIAKKAGVNRATTYVILKSLINKGLCSTFEQEKKTMFIAAEPALLEGMFEVQKKQLEEKQKYFKSLLPQLELINNQKVDKPTVKFFEGKQGLINCFMEFTSPSRAKKDEKYSYIAFSQDKLEKLFTPEDRKKFKEIRLKNQSKAVAKTIYNYKDGELPDNSEAVGIKVSEKDFPMPCDIGVYGDSVRVLSESKNLSGILITDHNIAITLKSIFELAWEAAKERAKKEK